MSESINVGDLVAEFIQACNVNTVFGVISVHNIPMLDAIGRRNAIRFVMARGEAGGGHMADAYARVTGELGVLFTSTGPGAANATGALVEARFAGTPMLHITGQTPTPYLDRGQGTVHDVADQLGMLRSVSKAAYRVRSAETALATLTQAATEALTAPTGPVSVEIPIDIQRQAVPPLPDGFALPLPPALPPAPQAVEQLADIVAAGGRPMLWCGSGAKHAGAAVRRLLDLGIPLVTSWAGRGVVSEDEALVLGTHNGNGSPMVEAFYRSVDVLIVAGSRLRGHETRDMTLQFPDRICQIDVDPMANGRTYQSELFVHGDAAVTLNALADKLEGRFKPEGGYADEIAALKRDAIAAYEDMLGSYAAFPPAVRAALPKDGLWVRDVTLSNSTWGHRLFPLHDTRSSVYPVGAAIGPGLPMGVGAAMGAKGRKTIAMCGDGGFFLSLAELQTAVQEQADVVFLVMNDQGYGVIKHIQDAMYGERHYFGDLKSPNLEQLAAAGDLPYRRIERTEDIGAVMAEAVAQPGPVLVEVDMTAIGPYPRYFAPPPFAEKKD